jgi:hypothetical protein
MQLGLGGRLLAGVVLASANLSALAASIVSVSPQGEVAQVRQVVVKLQRGRGAAG